MGEKRFFVKKEQGNGFTDLIKIIVDKETGVNYLWVTNGYSGGLTPLLDNEGKPVVTKMSGDQKCRE